MSSSPPGAAGPLHGITVLDLSTVGPAARCTRLLADYGADVVKVGPVPGRGPGAVVAPPHAYSAGRGTRQVRLDLRHDAGRQAFLSLAAGADVVVESFRPGVVDRLGIGYQAVRAVNESIVYVSTSGYGQDGPRSDWAGHDLDYLAVGGYLAMSGRGLPALPGATVADAAGGGLHGALAVCAALVRRAANGEGAYLDVAAADGVLWMMSLAVEEHMGTGTAIRPGHDVLSGRYACYRAYRTADGRFVAVAAIEAKFFANLCRALDLDRYIESQYDETSQDELRHALAEAFLRRTRDEWVAELAGADTCVAPVLEIEEVASDAHFAGRGAFVEARHPSLGPLRQLGGLLAGMAPPAVPVLLPDPGVSDSAALLRAAGMSAPLLASLLEAGVVA